MWGWEDSPGEGNGNPLQYSCLENPMDRGLWRASVHGVIRIGHDLVTKPEIWISKRQRNQRSNCQHLLDHRKSKRVPEKHILLFYWLLQNLCLCGSQQTVENSSRDGNTRPPYLPPAKSVCRSRSNSYNQTRKNRRIPNWERRMSRLYIVTLLI